MVRDDLKNIAIIAHVDHGKTTLVDGMLKQGGIFRENQHIETCVMDSNALERERGITILAKNTAIHYKGIKINVIDTPGHADFSGEVERVLRMVSGVLLLVDAAEGPMPQTRFVVQKALELGLKIIIIVNKIDRSDARLPAVADEILELFIALNATNEQLDSPIIYCSGKNASASLDFQKPGKDLIPLFDAIIGYIDSPSGDEKGDLQLLISAVDYNYYVGRIGIGRIERGTVKINQEVTICDYFQNIQPFKSKISALFQIEGLERVPVTEAGVGDIVCISGIENINIGNTVCAGRPEPVPFVKIGEPTMEMTFYVNNSPFAGREGTYVTSRQLKERLNRELLKDVSLKVTETESTDAFKVCGRGEMHLSVLIETMRREGYEFGVGTPKMLYRTVNDVVYEPYDKLLIDVPQEYTGAVMQSMGSRKGELIEMMPLGDRIRIEFLIPGRGLFGYKNELLTSTRGTGIMNASLFDYLPYKGDLPRRLSGSLVACETGETSAYGLYNAQERGILFVGAGVKVYEGMIVGVSPKSEDIKVNVCKRKHVTNMRASGSDEALRLNPVRTMSLEEAIEFITDDEMLEITPKNIRIRKRFPMKR